MKNKTSHRRVLVTAKFTCPPAWRFIQPTASHCSWLKGISNVQCSRYPISLPVFLLEYNSMSENDQTENCASPMTPVFVSRCILTLDQSLVCGMCSTTCLQEESAWRSERNSRDPRILQISGIGYYKWLFLGGWGMTKVVTTLYTTSGAKSKRRHIKENSQKRQSKSLGQKLRAYSM